jgi:hypothetical protein
VAQQLILVYISKTYLIVASIDVDLMIPLLSSYKSSKLSSSPHGIPTGSSPVGSVPKSSPQSQHLTFHLLEKNKLQPQRYVFSCMDVYYKLMLFKHYSSVLHSISSYIYIYQPSCFE